MGGRGPDAKRRVRSLRPLPPLASQASVFAYVVSLPGEQHEVLWRIVQPVTVPVVNDFSWTKRPSEDPFHHDSMLVPTHELPVGLPLSSSPLGRATLLSRPARQFGVVHVVEVEAVRPLADSGAIDRPALLPTRSELRPAPLARPRRGQPHERPCTSRHRQVQCLIQEVRSGEPPIRHVGNLLPYTRAGKNSDLPPRSLLVLTRCSGELDLHRLFLPSLPRFRTIHRQVKYQFLSRAYK